jgi:hypothetical protein
MQSQILVFFVNSSTFFSYPEYIPTLIPWEVWGPHNTRWFPGNQDHAIYGCRTVGTVSCETDDGWRLDWRKRLMVKDFNLGFVQGEEKGLRRRVVLGESVTRMIGATNSNVVSSLPYTEVVSEEKFDVTEVMMDDRTLLLFKVSIFTAEARNPR